MSQPIRSVAALSLSLASGRVHMSSTKGLILYRMMRKGGRLLFPFFFFFGEDEMIFAS